MPFATSPIRLEIFPLPKSKTTRTTTIAICQKLDIFKNSMWFSYKNESLDWFEIKADDVKKIIEINSAGKSISKLEDYSAIRESKNEKVFI